jgi:voltage-gated potassium channel
MPPRSKSREFVLAAASFVFLLSYTGLTLGESSTILAWAWVFAALVWLIFAVDVVLRAVKIGPAKYLRQYWWELLPLLLPVFRALRVVTFVRQLPYFRNPTQEHIRRRLVLEMLLSITLYVYVSSLTSYSIEHLAPGATIDSWGNAAWWTIVTMATVGYGDFTPVTILARLIAVCNMVVGVISIGVTSATVVNYLSELTSKAARERQEE